jgi:hypothetical protein
LTELSGGQRSLIALSLIMSLLQFKPAPMYILDEVDAALDLSHTQNIGRLIKTRFKGSQFIVVSLKDGMFQNANRIFRTRFSEGTSVVQALTVWRTNSSPFRALLTVTGGGFQVSHVRFGNCLTVKTGGQCLRRILGFGAWLHGGLSVSVPL